MYNSFFIIKNYYIILFGDAKLLVEEIMSKGVLTINSEKTVLDAANVLFENLIGSLIVEKDGKHIGIITETDMIGRVIVKGKNPKTTKILEIMTSELITITMNSTVKNAAKIMKSKKIKKLPVTSGKNQQIIGMITVTDISNVLPDFSNKDVEEKAFRFV